MTGGGTVIPELYQTQKGHTQRVQQPHPILPFVSSDLSAGASDVRIQIKRLPEAV